MKMLFVRVREYFRQYGSWILKRMLVDELEGLEILLETAVGENGDLPENEGVRINAFERNPLFLPYLFLEGTDRLCACNFNRKDVARVVAEDQAVECEWAVSG
jgi:hypothetical protein